MSSLTAAALRALCILTTALGLGASFAWADIVWNTQTGWHIEGGALSGLTGTDGRNALDLMNKAGKAEDAKHFGSALGSYEKVTKKYPTSIYAPEAYYRIARIRTARRQLYKAFDAYQEIINRYPNVKRFNEIIEAQYRISALLLNGAHNYTFGLVPTFPNRTRGIENMVRIVTNAPYSDYAPLALMEIARGLQYMGQTEEAIDALDRLVNNYSDSVIAPEAYLRLAKLHASLVEGPPYDQAETKQSLTYNEDFMILFPSDPKIGDAAQGLDTMKKMLAKSKMTIADFYFLKRDNYLAARVFYNEAITAYPGSDIAAQAHRRLAEVEKKAAASAAAGGVKKKHFPFL